MSNVLCKIATRNCIQARDVRKWIKLFVWIKTYNKINAAVSYFLQLQQQTQVLQRCVLHDSRCTTHDSVFERFDGRRKWTEKHGRPTVVQINEWNWSMWNRLYPYGTIDVDIFFYGLLICKFNDVITGHNARNFYRLWIFVQKFEEDNNCRDSKVHLRP